MTSPTLRRPPRVPFVRLLRVHPAGGGAPRRLWAQNVSNRGMFIRTAEPLPVGSRIRVGFTAPDQSLIDLGEARVTWQRPMGSFGDAPGFGIEFVKLDDTARLFLERTVSQAVAAANAEAQRGPRLEVEPPRRAPGFRPAASGEGDSGEQTPVGKLLPFRSAAG